MVDFFPDPDGRLPSSARTARIDYLRQIAQAADRLGFTGVLTPTGIQCEDAWLAAAALARRDGAAASSSWRSGRG